MFEKLIKNKHRFLVLSVLGISLGVFSMYADIGVLEIVLLFAGMIGVLYALSYPSQWIEDSFATISYRFRISSLVAGGLFLAIASSSAELFTAMSGVVWYKVFSIGFDTIIWSALFNLCIILGVATFYKPKIVISRSIIKRDMPFYGLTIVVLLLLAIDGKYTSTDFIILLILYGFYVLILYLDKSSPYKDKTNDSWRSVIIKLIVGLLLIAVLAHTMVTFGQETVKDIEQYYGIIVPVGLLAVTIYGPGTSMADLFMSISAIKKGEDSAAVVNGISSNTFDLTVCIGLPGLIYTIVTGHAIEINLKESILLISMLILSFLLVFFIMRNLRMVRRDGIILIVYFFVAMVIFITNLFI